MKISAQRNIDLCILIPCYNNFSGLIQSINSIFYQSEKYVVLIVDDGNKEPITDQSITQNLLKPTNFQIIRLSNNVGITKALNKGLEFIYANFSVDFIARLDCGDICTPERFNKQIMFLNANPDVRLVGSWCYFKNYTSGLAYQYITPTQHKKIKRSMNFRNVFIHPTVMWRITGINNLKYPEQYLHAEDYGMFYDMVSKQQSAIINEFLVTCEINEKGISILNRALQLKSRLKIISDYSKNEIWFLLGAAKLKVLMLLPYQFVLLTKKRLKLI